MYSVFIIGTYLWLLYGTFIMRQIMNGLRTTQAIDGLNVSPPQCTIFKCPCQLGIGLTIAYQCILHESVIDHVMTKKLFAQPIIKLAITFEEQLHIQVLYSHLSC